VSLYKFDRKSTVWQPGHWQKVAHTHTHKYTCIYTHTHICIGVYIYIYVCIHTYTLRTCALTTFNTVFIRTAHTHTQRKFQQLDVKNKSQDSDSDMFRDCCETLKHTMSETQKTHTFSLSLSLSLLGSRARSCSRTCALSHTRILSRALLRNYVDGSGGLSDSFDSAPGNDADKFAELRWPAAPQLPCPPSICGKRRRERERQREFV